MAATFVWEMKRFIPGVVQDETSLVQLWSRVSPHGLICGSFMVQYEVSLAHM